jgi:integrase/recombinase XerD
VNDKNDLAPLLQGFFTDTLARQRQASGHTVTAYRDTFRLLLAFVAERTGIPPSRMGIADLDAPTIGAFLQHLETERGNAVTTRNARLAAIRSFFGYAAVRAPESSDTIARVLAIPVKRHDKATVSFLTRAEADALIAAPDRSTWTGRRDHALLLLAVQTGLRVGELTAVRLLDVNLGPGPHVRCHGKGRKDRCTPLTGPTVKVLRVWIRERGGVPEDPLFPTRRGTPLSRDAVGLLVTKHTATAAKSCPTLLEKTVTPHTLRHSTAMALLQAGVDATVIALWLGHEGTDTVGVYLHADMTVKQRALDRVAPPGSKPGRYHAPDSLLAFLETI